LTLQLVTFSPFIPRCPIKPIYNCMLLADGWGDVSNEHDIILLRLLGCSSRTFRTSSPGRSFNRLVLQENNASGSRPRQERLP
jgi:hypothetical protein